MKTRTVENALGEKFTITELGDHFFNIGIRQWREEFDKDHFIIKTVNRPFDTKMFSVPHTPIVISDVSNELKFSRKNDLRILDMPIKFPGSSEYRIPKELTQFDEVISKIASFEAHINPSLTECYHAYITVDQGEVPANTFHRKPGCHVDGFQGVRYKLKRPVTRSYIIFDCISPVFYAQKFRTDHLDEAKHNFFLSFDEQAEQMYGMTFDPYTIILMNSYTVHQSDMDSIPHYRTFFRLSFDTRKYDRFGNTHNPCFRYNWNMVTRATQTALVHKPVPRYHPDAL